MKTLKQNDMKTEELKTKKFTYQILSKDITVAQKTFTRTVSNNYNAYSEFEEKAMEYFKGYDVKFNHVGRLIVLSPINY